MRRRLQDSRLDMGIIRIAAAAGFLATAAAPAHAGAQQRAVDRWLVASGEFADGANAMSASDVAFFPDRDLEVGPGSWTLVREDGRSSFDFSELTEPGESTLAHVYLKAEADVDVRLSLEPESCGTAETWLNGQALTGGSPVRDIRLAGGWNTLFVILRGPADCARGLSATLAPPAGPVDRDAEPFGTGDLVIQASRPPGVRRNHPEGSVTVSAPRVTGLRWDPGADDLSASFSYELTSWGRGTAVPVETDGPTGPPTVDLTGDWNLRLFGPTGIQRLIARLEMDEDGGLSGELRVDRRDLDGRRQERQFGRGDAFAGDISAGWVSGRQFSWTLTTELMRRRVEVEFRGAFEAGRLRGTIDLGRLGDDVVNTVESRFEGTPDGETGPAELPRDPTVDPTADEPADAGFPTPFEVPRAGAGRGAAGGATDPTGPSDPDGLRARMIRQLRGAPPSKARAPGDGSARLRLAGESFVASSASLAPGVPVAFDGSLPFRKLRDSALRDDGIRAEIRWADGDRDASGRVDAAAVLRAFHGPIELGLPPTTDAPASAELRVPEALAGFTLRGLGGSWWVDGEPVTDGVLCSPCERGRRIRVGYRDPAETPPLVEVSDRGFPDLSEESPVSALEWLRALQGDNRRYRELAGT